MCEDEQFIDSECLIKDVLIFLKIFAINMAIALIVFLQGNVHGAKKKIFA